MTSKSGFIRKPGKFIRIKDIRSVEIELLRDGEKNLYLHEEKINRVRIFGTVLRTYNNLDQETKKFASITIDDGSDTINVKTWGDIDELVNVKSGDIIDVLGKLRHYNDEFYIAFEEISQPKSIDYEIKMRAELIERDFSIYGQLNQEERIPDFISVDSYKVEPKTNDNEGVVESLSEEEKKKLILSHFTDDKEDNTVERLIKVTGMSKIEVEDLIEELRKEVAIISYGDGKYERAPF